MTSVSFFVANGFTKETAKHPKCRAVRYWRGTADEAGVCNGTN
jgi:hypothetical protein